MLFLWTTEDAAQALQDAWDLIHPEGPGIFVQQNLIEASPQFGLWLVEWTTSYELRKLTASWTRLPPSGIPQDAAQCTFHFLNLTAGVPDATWTSGDYTTVESAFDTFWGALVGFYASTVKLSEFVWRADGPAFRPFGSSLSPTLRRTARSAAGTGFTGGTVPDLTPQSAITVTEVTDAHFTVTDVEGSGTQVRNRWGRFYLPACLSANCRDGRLIAATQTAIANAVNTFYDAMSTAQLVPVMYSPTTGHAWNVTEIHVDDIFDVVRSRRYITPLSRAVNTITPP